MDGLSDQYLVIILVFLICGSAFFSASETAFSTCNKIKLKQLANKGSERAEKTLKLAEEYDKLISGILIGNNFVNICATTVATILFTKSFVNGAEISTIIMTIVVLIFGEVTPKTIAKNNPEKFVLKLYPLLNAILVILTPFTMILGQLQNAINIIMPAEKQSFTGDELITIVEEGEKDGIIEKEDSELIQSAIEFKDASISEIYVPRVDLTALDIAEDVSIFEKTFKEKPYSRIPVFEETIDNIIGFVHYRDFYHLEKNQNLKDILQKPLFMPLTTDVSDALKIMKKEKIHLAIVCDEYGGTAGMITLEDIIEELVGDIYDEHDEIIEEIVKLENNAYKVDGGTNISDVYDLFDLIDDEDYESVTISGWIVEHNEKIPSINDILIIKGFEIKILDADEKKINLIKIKKID